MEAVVDEVDDCEESDPAPLLMLHALMEWKSPRFNLSFLRDAEGGLDGLFGSDDLSEDFPVGGSPCCTGKPWSVKNVHCGVEARKRSLPKNFRHAKLY